MVEPNIIDTFAPFKFNGPSHTPASIPTVENQFLICMQATFITL